MAMTEKQAAALRQLQRMNGRADLRSLVDQFIAAAEQAIVSNPANENDRVEFLKLRELRGLLFGD